jgi:hypothetical protein
MPRRPIPARLRVPTPIRIPPTAGFRSNRLLTEADPRGHRSVRNSAIISFPGGETASIRKLGTQSIRAEPNAGEPEQCFRALLTARCGVALAEGAGRALAGKRGRVRQPSRRPATMRVALGDLLSIPAKERTSLLGCLLDRLLNSLLSHHTYNLCRSFSRGRRRKQ